MKRIIYFAFIIMLTGCVGETRTTQILMQSIDDEMLPKSEMLLDPNVAARSLESAMNISSEKATSKKTREPDLQHLKKYTIQVVALSHNKGFNEYISKLPMGKPMWTNKKVVKGFPWYTLLYGEFNSKDHAQCVLDTLPSNIKKHGPFIRSFSAIKSSSTPEMIKLK